MENIWEESPAEDILESLITWYWKSWNGGQQRQPDDILGRVLRLSNESSFCL